MINHKLGKTDINISPVIYGGIVSMNDGQDKSDRYVDWAVQKGVNYFDVAPTYGDAQEKLGNSLKTYRKDIYLACKTAERSAENAEREMYESLRLLHTDYFDVYQIHALGSIEDVEAAFGKGGVMETMRKAKDEGIARYLGITCHNEDAALRALDLYDFDTVMFPVNWGLNIAKNIGTRLSITVKKRSIGFLGMKALIHRAWQNGNEQAESSFPKSWCKPIYGDDIFATAAMKYAFYLGVDAIVPPGNFESFSFAAEHADDCLANPITGADIDFLKQKAKEIDGLYFF